METTWCIGCGNYLEVGPAGYCPDCFPLLPAEAMMLIDYALKIAQYQRNEDHLQPVGVLITKLEREKEEFAVELAREKSDEQHLDLLSEAADLVYYAAQLDTYGINVRPEVNGLLAEANIYRWDAVQAAVTKYRLRSASPNSKDKDAEREALRVI